MTTEKNKDFGTKLFMAIWIFAEWLENSFTFGDQYIYRSADVYVPKNALVPMPTTELRLESDSVNLRQNCTTKRWQIRQTDAVTGLPEWSDLNLAEEEMINTEFTAGRKPVFKFLM